jgi:hypothetical protein
VATVESAPRSNQRGRQPAQRDGDRETAGTARQVRELIEHIVASWAKCAGEMLCKVLTHSQLRCGRCVAGTNPPQPKGPKREPTQQTHGGRTGHPQGGPPQRRLLPSLVFFTLEVPSMKGE